MICVLNILKFTKLFLNIIVVYIKNNNYNGRKRE